MKDSAFEIATVLTNTIYSEEASLEEKMEVCDYVHDWLRWPRLVFCEDVNGHLQLLLSTVEPPKGETVLS